MTDLDQRTPTSTAAWATTVTTTPSAGRFDYYMPGWVRMTYTALRHRKDWRERCRPWVTDRQRGDRFQLSEDEELMMDVLHENVHALVDIERVPLRRIRRFWPPEKVFIVRDRVLQAISDRRRGDDRDWQRLKAMTPGEWLMWLRVVQSE